MKEGKKISDKGHYWYWINIVSGYFRICRFIWFLERRTVIEMREILFRGKRIDNGEWVEGYFVNLWMMHYQKYQPIITDKNAVSYDVDLATVGQYTGLTDKNGKRIFEGDIIDASDEWLNTSGPTVHDSPIILVECYNNFCGFEPFVNYDCDYGVYIFAENCEILGNIHDNPELLKMRND